VVILRIPAIVRLHRVPVPHTNEATYVLDGAGQRWVAKREADMGCEALLAEALTWLLARQVGVPVPDAAFCDDPSERAWLSAWLPHAKHWSAGLLGPVRNPKEAAAILALDAVVFNEARHGGNLLVVEAAGGASVVAIDADEARIGHPADLAAMGLVPPQPYILARGFPPGDWRVDALAAAERFVGLSEEALNEMVAEACDVAREPATAAVSTVLIERCRAAISLTEQYLALVGAEGTRLPGGEPRRSRGAGS
jgi:hypothetical protein